MKRIYLAGPMSGIPEFNYPAFNAEAARLRALGYDVVNPAEITPEHPGAWESHMRADIAQLVTCDTIAVLDGWDDSEGARLEVHIATALEMTRRLASGIVAPCVVEERAIA